MWNPESWALKSVIQVPLTKNPKSSTWISKSMAWNSKTFLDSLEWCQLWGSHWESVLVTLINMMFSGPSYTIKLPHYIDVPATRLYTWGSLLLITQWAAVMAHLGLTREAPQEWPFMTLSDSCQGHEWQEWGEAVEPSIILASGRCPQSFPQPFVSKINRSTIKIND